MPLLSLPLAAATTAAADVWGPCLRIAALSWSTAALAKFTALDRQTRSLTAAASASSGTGTSNSSSRNAERRYLSFYHLLVVLSVLRVGRPSLPCGGINLLRDGWRALLLLSAVISIDELVLWCVRRQLAWQQRRWICVGQPAPAALAGQDDCCMICHGVGLGDWQPHSARHTTTTEHSHSTVSVVKGTAASVKAKSSELSTADGCQQQQPSKHFSHSRHSSISNDNDASIIHSDNCTDADSDDRLESFCTAPEHVAHRGCMRAWWQAQRERRGTNSGVDDELLMMTAGSDRYLLAPPASVAATAASVRCPSCRRRSKFTVQPARATATEALLQGRLSSGQWLMRVLRETAWRKLAGDFLRHLMQRDTIHRSLVTLAAGLLMFALAMSGGGSTPAAAR